MKSLLLALILIFSAQSSAAPCDPLPTDPPSEKEIQKFLNQALLPIADDLGFDPILFLRNDDSEFLKALTPQNYAISCTKPVPAGPLVLFQGRLYPKDFYRVMAYSPSGQQMKDNRPPHLIGKDQWSIDTTKGTFNLEKASGTAHLLSWLIQPNKPIILYRGVRNSEAQFYKTLHTLKLKGDTATLVKFQQENLKFYQEDSTAGVFTTPDAKAAAQFGIRDNVGTIVAFQIDPRLITEQIRSGIYIGVESDYFEIAFSSKEARRLMLDSFLATYDAPEFLALLAKQL